MKNFFDARRIAVIGAARENYKIGNVIFGNLLPNKNLRVFPVNPNADEILGVKCFGDVLAIPYPVDLAVIAVPAVIVPKVLEDCGKKEIKNVIIISSGFSETGNFELAEKTKRIAEKYDIKIIGPNVLGIINPYKNLNASFFRDMPEKGSVAFVSQSGAVGTSILDRAVEEKLGFSSFISLGNMMQQDFISALEYLDKDVYTEVIMLYIESLKENTGKDFVELCKRISKRKKIIAIKAGKTEKGMEAAKTHTASMSSNAKIYSGAFKQAGIIEVDSLEEMFKLAKIFSKTKIKGKKACIITNAGGLGILATDECVKSGLKLEEIPENVLKELDLFMPKIYSRRNPLDILGDALAERYEKVLKVIGRHEIFDFFLVILSPQEMTQPLLTCQLISKTRKPVFFFLVEGKSFNEARKFLRSEGKIFFDDVSDIKIIGKALG